jgi:hypothetical protein
MLNTGAQTTLRHVAGCVIGATWITFLGTNDE